MKPRLLDLFCGAGGGARVIGFLLTLASLALMWRIHTRRF